MKPMRPNTCGESRAYARVCYCCSSPLRNETEIVKLRRNRFEDKFYEADSPEAKAFAYEEADGGIQYFGLDCAVRLLSLQGEKDES